MSNRPRRNSYSSLKTWVKNNSEYAQFLINSGLVVITVVTLVTTSYFSYRSLSESGKQLNLAQRQFTTSLNQRKTDSADSKSTNALLEDNRKRDSLISEQRFKSQEKRNSLQDSINKEQLKAIQAQANLAKLQLQAQILVNKQAYYDARPVFMIIKAKYDSVKRTCLFTVLNTGKRPAIMLNTKLCAYNHQFNKFYSSTFPKLNWTINNQAYLEVLINAPKDIFFDSGTAYYISLAYTDGIDGKKTIFEKYFLFDRMENYGCTTKEADSLYVSLTRKKGHELGFKFSNSVRNTF
ncbi:hypothetical protein EWM62_15515 [Mucilaginibacter terrigena]|uniref:Uncharacterized protein n=1 Tax=Mucilaginibacter terrigena TaxID=2492395 RepID=A0A4Q5LK63_9SPHI|nr:hypothetical protein [Mucilaginibacter terrigena]RYU87901.1 hypothetical protein EWM62_15515 [Mucilaginibacter terrigena]